MLLTENLPPLGARISLLSIMDSRFEGVLIRVDLIENAICLASVRLFGTEGRALLFPLPPSPYLINFVPFAAYFIKDVQRIAMFTPLPMPGTPLPLPPFLNPNIPVRHLRTIWSPNQEEAAIFRARGALLLPPPLPLPPLPPHEYDQY